MAFNHQHYNTQYVLNARNGGEPINDAAEKYGVRIVEADVAEGETYWKVIGVHHLLPLENFSNHHVYLEALDEQGQRIRNPIAWAGWTWQGRRPHERADPVALDKPDSEAAGNIAIHFGQIVSVWINGTAPNANEKSDRVVNLHSAHPDEPTADGRLLNTLGHHSFYVVFQRTRKTASMTDGIIRGRLERGQGRVVRLLKNNQVVAQQQVNASLQFNFTGLTPGIYSLEVVDTDIRQDNIQISPTSKEVVLNLAVPIPDDSIIFGRVRNGAGKTLLLLKEGNIIARLRIPTTETFRFTDLAAGVYSLHVFETDVRQDNIAVDGTNSREITLVVPETPPVVPEGKTINHYLLLGQPGSRGRRVNMLIAVEYILAFSITAGFSLNEAKQARQVTVIGDLTPTDRQTLENAGCKVEHLTGDAYEIEAELANRIRAGRAFGG